MDATPHGNSGKAQQEQRRAPGASKAAAIAPCSARSHASPRARARPFTVAWTQGTPAHGTTGSQTA
ncbi:hypothetical protein E2562_030296 [Oryza meyeriana var. granulata]|uniref:Uncharacterized protein n=1 Tax=Oryza meyeriana var. granulata TaxID=110450 RepID=A0A6G1EZR2_9ORYZ|nr:hypothetical protein E2562_030296 [Oryza meyeriana var. granulata]